MIGTTSGLSIRGGRFRVRGKPVRQLWGRSSFKLSALLSYYFAGRNGEIPGGAKAAATRWIEHNQQIFGEGTVFRVFLETGFWGRIPRGTGMFGAPPHDLGFWNTRQLAGGHKPSGLTQIAQRTLRWFFEQSEQTGCVFELIVDATLKHEVRVGIVDHCIRLVAAHMRVLQEEFPKACILVNARNEWDAHNSDTNLWACDMWSTRFYRWKLDRETKLSFTHPGPGWEPEQWPSGIIIVDHGGRDDFDYTVDGQPGSYKAGMIHPVRAKSGRDWRQLPDMERLRSLSHGMPVGFSESMYLVTEPDETGSWYRNRNGWTGNLKDVMQFYANCLDANEYMIVHDDKGVQCDYRWPMFETRLEAELRSMFGGTTPPPQRTRVFLNAYSEAEVDGAAMKLAKDGFDGIRRDVLWKVTDADLDRIMVQIKKEPSLEWMLLVCGVGVGMPESPTRVDWWRQAGQVAKAVHIHRVAQQVVFDIGVEAAIDERFRNNPEYYAELVNYASEAIWDELPKATVVTTVTNSVAHLDYVASLVPLLDARLGISIHTYRDTSPMTPMPGFASREAEFEAMRNVLGDRQLWNTETGWHSAKRRWGMCAWGSFWKWLAGLLGTRCSGQWTEEEIGRFLIEEIRYHRAYQAGGFVVYQAFSGPADTPEHQYGLLDVELKPKPRARILTQFLKER